MMRMTGDIGESPRRVAPLRIPQQDREAVQTLAGLSTDAVETLERALGEQRPTLYLRDLVERARGQQPELTSDVLSAVVDVLLTLFAVREMANVPLDTFATAVARSESLDLHETARVRLQETISRLMHIHALAVTAKAMSVLGENPHTFHAARIITDIRYLFDENVVDIPSVAVITHLVRITTHTASGLEEFFFGLDRHNLAELKTIIERAESKEETLTAALEKTGVTVLTRELA